MERYIHQFNNSIRCIGLQRQHLKVAGPISAAGASTVSGRGPLPPPHIPTHLSLFIRDNMPIMFTYLTLQYLYADI